MKLSFIIQIVCIVGRGQVPFISINYGTDTSKEGRLLIKQLLKATQAGLGKGKHQFFLFKFLK